MTYKREERSEEETAQLFTCFFHFCRKNTRELPKIVHGFCHSMVEAR
jgi:hypothetical protein